VTAQLTDEEKSIRLLVVSRTIDRLAVMYSDWISQKGFDGIPDFFRNHLYSPANKEARDAALDNLYNKLKSVTGPEMTANIHMLIELNRLTDDLDLDTARVLMATTLQTTRPEDLTFDQLFHAVRQTGRKEERKKQVQMVSDALTFFFSLSKLPLIKLVMAPIKVAASLVGAMDLISTMEAGYALSRNIKDMTPFVEAFVKREVEFIDSDYTAHSLIQK
jgi:hypothetical protein